MVKKTSWIGLIFLFWQTLVNASPSFMIIIDAGSTGSRLHLYRYEKNASSNIPKIKEVINEKVRPGISTTQIPLSRIAKTLDPLLQHAEIVVKEQGGRVDQTKLYLLATGGMRLVEKDKQDRIYNKINQYLESHHKFQIDRLKTISGKQEAIFGWLAVNDLTGRLKSRKQTYGLLDLGGASVEIAFVSNSNDENVEQVCLGKKCYQLYAKSYLNIGLDNGMSEVPDFPKPSYCYPRGYPYQNAFVGDYNYDYCESIARTQVMDKMDADIEYILPVDKPFIATSGFYYSFEFFDAKPNLNNLQKKAKEVCEHESWQQMLDEHPLQSSDKIAKYCYASALVVALLTHPSGFGFDYGKENLEVYNKYHGQDISWARGAALYFIAGPKTKALASKPDSELEFRSASKE